MRISEVIKKLNAVKKEHGDIDVFHYVDEFGRCFDASQLLFKVERPAYQPYYGDSDYRADLPFVEYLLPTKEDADKATEKILIL